MKRNFLQTRGCLLNLYRDRLSARYTNYIPQFSSLQRRLPSHTRPYPEISISFGVNKKP